VVVCCDLAVAGDLLLLHSLCLLMGMGIWLIMVQTSIEMEDYANYEGIVCCIVL
jgi:hypothetical protein